MTEGRRSGRAYERVSERDFSNGGEIVIGSLHAWMCKSTTADNPLFRINIVAFFSSTNGGSRASNKHIAGRNPLILDVRRKKKEKMKLSTTIFSSISIRRFRTAPIDPDVIGSREEIVRIWGAIIGLSQIVVGSNEHV